MSLVQVGRNTFLRIGCNPFSNGTAPIVGGLFDWLMFIGMVLQIRHSCHRTIFGSFCLMRQLAESVRLTPTQLDEAYGVIISVIVV